MVRKKLVVLKNSIHDEYYLVEADNSVPKVFQTIIFLFQSTRSVNRLWQLGGWLHLRLVFDKAWPRLWIMVMNSSPCWLIGLCEEGPRSSSPSDSFHHGKCCYWSNNAIMLWKWICGWSFYSLDLDWHCKQSQCHLLAQVCCHSPSVCSLSDSAHTWYWKNGFIRD